MNKSKYDVSDEEMASLIEGLDEMLCESEPDFYVELRDAAWNILHENPGSEFGDWRNMLIEQFPSELVDAFGSDPEEVYARLADWWESEDYEDENTGMNERFRDWAEYFATEKSVELYDMLVESCMANKKLSERISTIDRQNILIEDEDFYGK